MSSTLLHSDGVGVALECSVLGHFPRRGLDLDRAGNAVLELEHDVEQPLGLLGFHFKILLPRV